MDAGKKKPIMLGIAIVCLVLAGGITYLRLAGNPNEIAKGEMMWVKCANPNCNYEGQMEVREYARLCKASKSGLPKCPKCGEESLLEAIKCEKCGIVFIPGTVQGEIRDRCPECGYSKIKGDTKPVK
jgi:DNA-directed RNA polymerase subunit M/transcription elongation factor TFIIS